MIVIEFLVEHDQYKVGDILPIERTLALRLIGIGKAKRPEKKPEFKKPIRTGAKVEPVRAKEVEEKTEEKPAQEKPKKKATSKKKPGRPKKEKRIEKAVIE